MNSGVILSTAILILTHETFISQPNALTAIFQDALIGDWRDGVKDWSGSRYSTKSKYRYADQRLSSVVTSSPMVLPRCTHAQNASTGPSQINFPVKTWTPRNTNASNFESAEWEVDEKPQNLTIFSLNKSKSIRYEWVDLPTDRFGPVSGGLLIQLSGSATNTLYVVIGCTISASWSSREIISDSYSHEAAWSFSDQNRKLVGPNIRADLNASSAEADKYRRLIVIRSKWFQSLVPFVPCVNRRYQSKLVTTLECLFSDVGLLNVTGDLRTHGQARWKGKICAWQLPNSSETDVDRWNHIDCGGGAKYQLFEWIIASVLANGLSRYGSHHAFEPSSIDSSRYDPFGWVLKSLPKAPDYYNSLLSNKPHHNAIFPAPANTDHVDLRMRVQVVGYAWCASSFSDYLAIAVILIYMLVVLTHTVWVLATGVTSSSWDTPTELLALVLYTVLTVR